MLLRLPDLRGRRRPAVLPLPAEEHERDRGVAPNRRDRPQGHLLQGGARRVAGRAHLLQGREHRDEVGGALSPPTCPKTRHRRRFVE